MLGGLVAAMLFAVVAMVLLGHVLAAALLALGFHPLAAVRLGLCRRSLGCGRSRNDQRERAEYDRLHLKTFRETEFDGFDVTQDGEGAWRSRSRLPEGIVRRTGLVE